MNFIEICTWAEFESAVKLEKASLFYFSAPACNICKVLKPKIIDSIQINFPELKLFYTDIEKSPLLAGQLRIFSIPTLLVYFDSKEFYRVSRNVSIMDLEEKLKRPYSLLF